MTEILEVLKTDVATLVMLIGSLGIMMLLNIVLGGVMASANYQWDTATFFKGILKAFLVALVMVVYCIVLEVFPLILSRLNIEIPNEMITFVQVVGIVVLSFTKYAKDIFDKLMTLLGVEEQEVVTDGNHIE